MNDSIKTYLILSVFSVIQIAGFVDSFSQQHALCLMHHQVEESQHEDSRLFAISKTNSLKSESIPSESDLHKASSTFNSAPCKSLASFYSTCRRSGPIKKELVLAISAYKLSPLTQSPNNSPPTIQA